MSSDTPGFKVTTANIGFAMAIVGVLTLGWNISGYFASIAQKNLEQDMRLDRTDRDRERFNASINTLTDKTVELKEAVVRLTAVIESGTRSRKAELLLPSPVPSLVQRPFPVTFDVAK